MRRLLSKIKSHDKIIGLETLSKISSNLFF